MVASAFLQGGERRSEIVFDVPPGAFTPPPKVTSSLVHFRPRPDPLPCRVGRPRAGDAGGVRPAAQDAAPEPEEPRAGRGCCHRGLRPQARDAGRGGAGRRLRRARERAGRSTLRRGQAPSSSRLPSGRPGPAEGVEVSLEAFDQRARLGIVLAPLALVAEDPLQPPKVS